MIPAQFRRIIQAEAGETLVISKGKEKCLNLYPLKVWNEVILKELHALEPGPEKRNLIRFYSEKSHQVNVDKAGRVAIPSNFLFMIGNTRKVVVIGALTYIEIWAMEDFGEIKKNALKTYIEGNWQY